MFLRSESAYGEKVGVTLPPCDGSRDGTFHQFLQPIDTGFELMILEILAAANLGLRVMRYKGEENFNKIRKMGAKSLRKAIVLVEDLLNAVTVESGEGISMNFSSCNFVEEVKLVFAEARESYEREI